MFVKIFYLQIMSFLAESDDIKICHTASKSLEFRVSLDTKT